jgi:mitochondrial fission protein ELM1
VDSTHSESLVVWRLIDGKPGHENQTLGLVEALKRCGVALEVHTIQVSGFRLSPADLIMRRFSAGNDLPSPALIVGAGHRTHLPMLMARRARGGRVVVLMKPSLPVSLFDLCVIPEHDGAVGSEKVLVTRGVLNPMHRGQHQDMTRGLFLLGGPSSSYGWSSAEIVAQVAEIARFEVSKRFVLTTSRRTPQDAVRLLMQHELDNVEIVPFEATAPGWVAEQLSRVGVAWVSEDSVSMVYESLTAGAAVGVLRVPRLSESRVSRGLDMLSADRLVTLFDDWRDQGRLRHPERSFNEAVRCAEWIKERWLSRS